MKMMFRLFDANNDELGIAGAYRDSYIYVKWVDGSWDRFDRLEQVFEISGVIKIVRRWGY